MAITKFTPPAVPFDASPGVRQYLDEQMRRLALLVNGAAQVDEAETINGDWTFSGSLSIPEAAVTDHEDALTIIESQITDGSILARLAADETVTGAWTYDGLLTTSDGRITATSGNNLDLLSGLARLNVAYRGISNDVTDTISIPNHGGLIFILAATTSATELNGYAILMAAGTSITTLHSGSLFSIGAAGSNPDVDGDSNIWIGSAGTLSVKNRRGSFRRYTVYSMNGGA